MTLLHSPEHNVSVRVARNKDEQITIDIKGPHAASARVTYNGAAMQGQAGSGGVHYHVGGAGAGGGGAGGSSSANGAAGSCCGCCGVGGAGPSSGHGAAWATGSSGGASGGGTVPGAGRTVEVRVEDHGAEPIPDTTKT